MDSALAAIAEKLAWSTESRKSVEIQVRQHTKSNMPVGPGSFNVTRDRYIETANGERFYQQEGLADGVLKHRSTHYLKEGKSADVSYIGEKLDIQSSVVLNRQFWMEDRSDRRQVPVPLLFNYVGREPLYKALKHGQRLDKTRVVDRDCEVVLFPDVRWFIRQDQVFYLDSETGVPLKVEAYRVGTKREPGDKFFDWTATELEQAGGARPMVVKRSTMNNYSEGRPDFSWDFEVESLVFDRTYPPSTFWPVIGQGVVVTDSAARKISMTSGENPAIAEAEAKASTSQLPPVDATQPTSWTTYAPGASVALGLAVLACAWVLRRRGG